MSQKKIIISILVALIVGGGSFAIYKITNKPQLKETIKIEQPTNEENENLENSEIQEQKKAEKTEEEQAEPVEKVEAQEKEKTSETTNTQPTKETIEQQVVQEPQEITEPQEEQIIFEVQDTTPQPTREPKDWGVCNTPPENPGNGDTYTTSKGYIWEYDAEYGDWFAIKTSGSNGGGATGGGVLDNAELSGEYVGNWG